MSLNLTQAESLHAEYVRLTGLDVRYTHMHRFYWENWIVNGFTREDLALAVSHLRKKFRNDPIKFAAATRFRNFIGNPECFAEDLAEAKAFQRKPKVDTGKTSVLAATGRSAPETGKDNYRSVADIIAGEKAFEAFRALKNTL